jgi:uncharacterized membrane protein
LGGTNSLALAIGQEGQATGTAQTTEGSWHACLWQTDGTPLDLGEVDGRPTTTGLFVQRNEQAQDLVAGVYADADGLAKTFFWADGAPPTTTVLGTLGGQSTVPMGMNTSGQVVGASMYRPWLGMGGDWRNLRHAFSWTLGGGLIDLTPTASDSEANAVNDAGVVVGYLYPRAR